MTYPETACFRKPTVISAKQCHQLTLPQSATNSDSSVTMKLKPTCTVVQKGPNVTRAVRGWMAQ